MIIGHEITLHHLYNLICEMGGYKKVIAFLTC